MDEGGPVASFRHAVHVGHGDATMSSVVRVLLGLSESVEDVRRALVDGPKLFVSYLAAPTFADSIAAALVDRARRGHDALPIDLPEVTELVQHYLETRFVASTVRIGADGAYNFQRLIYNVCACRGASASVRAEDADDITTLRRATCLTAEFADAVKRWLPVAPWVGSWWSSWHVLCYTLEMTVGTELSADAPKTPHPLAFLLFCDVIVEHVLAEWDATAAPIASVTDYRSSSFAWVACSSAWSRVLGSCCKCRATAALTPNASAFLAAAATVFAAPAPTPAPPPASPMRDDQSRPMSPSDRRLAGGGGKRKAATAGLVYSSPGSDAGARRATARVDRAGVTFPKLAL